MTIVLETALNYGIEGTGLIEGFDRREFEFFQSGNESIYSRIVTVPFAAEADLDVSALPSTTVVYIENVGNEFITYGPKSGGVMVPLGELYPGEYMIWRISSGATLRWQADTADCNAAIWLFE